MGDVAGAIAKTIQLKLSKLDLGDPLAILKADDLLDHCCNRLGLQMVTVVDNIIFSLA